MKKTLFMLLVAVMPLIATAQEEEVKVKVKEREQAPSWSGFVTNRFWDNWFISISAGGQVYFGEFDSKEDFGRRITPTFDFSIGKWIVPTLGARVQAGGFTLRGLTNDPNNIYAKGVSNKGEGLYKQKWQQFNIHVDGLLNLSNWIGGYRTDRFYEAIPFAGFGMIHGCQSDGTTDFMFVGGLINKFRLSDAFDFNVEIKGSLVPQKFDGEVGGSRGEGILGVSAGFTYKFNQRKFRREKKAEIISTGISPADLAAVEALLAEQTARAQQLQDALAQERAKARQEAVQVAKESKAAPLAIFFKINKANITAKEMINLKYYAEIIKENPNKKYKVTGYADKATGTPAYNQKLSEKRARNVADALIKKFGVNPNQLEVIGMGGVDGLYNGDIQLNRVAIVE
ncbi:OmpA family protein [Gabonibacter chumensis]|uniref:OmpA family protein n=1 Tax=Gabonibacter chumensis TaxID=2972474 RepID=UPI002572E23C|nr:OmpA family protein [Gabonibacter chumensis]MCR9012065.1 OmpA family protein [Gabonibacter chumensis]